MLPQQSHPLQDIIHMTNLFFSYKDLSRLAYTYFGLQVRFGYSGDNSFTIHCSAPKTGIRKLFIYNMLNTHFVVHGVTCTETETRLNFLPDASSSLEFLQVLVQYINYCLGKPALHVNLFWEVIVYLNEYDLRLRSVTFTKSGLKIRMKDNPALKEQIRMVRMLLRAGYKHVRLVRSADTLFPVYAFSDDALDYQLHMAAHTADIYLQTSMPMPDWLAHERFREEMKEWSGKSAFGSLTMNNDSLTVGKPLVIAEKQINAKTIRRAVSSMRSEISSLLIEILCLRDEPPVDDPTISWDKYNPDNLLLDIPSPPPTAE